MNIVEVTELRKRYGPIEAVKGVTFSVGPGERVVMLGPNGSGKTTTLEAIGGFIRPTSGRVRVLGVDAAQLSAAQREQMGFVFQDKPGLYGELSVRETLELFGGYYRDAVPAQELLNRLGLAEKQHRWVRNLSGGERRRLELAVALIGRPRLVFLDEPTGNLDPEARLQIWNLVEGLAMGGVTFILTTHHLEEAERLGRRILLLREGELIFDGSPEAMIGRAALPHRISFRSRNPDLLSSLAGRIRAEGDRLTLLSLQPEDDLLALRGSGAGVEDVRVQSPSLEEAYLALFKGGSHDHPRPPNALGPSLVS